jgi:hypothetical protein
MEPIDLPNPPPKAFKTGWNHRVMGILLALGALAVLWLACGRPLYSLYDEQGGPYYLTTQTADLDGDGDLDVLVYDGGRLALGLNQAGVQNGQLVVSQIGLDPLIECLSEITVPDKRNSSTGGFITSKNRWCHGSPPSS